MSNDELAEHRPIYDGFCIVGVAILFGPPIGGFILGLGSIILTLFHSAYELMSGGAMTEIDNANIFSILLIPFLYAFWSYIFGFIPALGASVAVSVYAAFYRELPAKIVLFFVFVASALFAVFMFMGDEWSVTPLGLLVFAVFVGIGWLAAFALMLFVEPLLSIAQSEKVVQ